MAWTDITRGEHSRDCTHYQPKNVAQILMQAHIRKFPHSLGPNRTLGNKITLHHSITQPAIQFWRGGLMVNDG